MRLRLLLGVIGALVACRSYEAPSFDAAGAAEAVRRLLGAETQAERLAWVPVDLARRLRALPEQPPQVVRPDAASLVLDERARGSDRVAYRGTWRERRGPDVSDAHGWFTLVQEEGRPLVLWRSPLVDEAWGLVSKGRVAEGQRRLDALLEEDDHDPVLLERAGWAALRRSQIERAEALFAREAVLEPASATPLASLAAVRVRQNRLDEALRLLTDAVARERTVEALANLGEVQRRLGRLDEAKTTLGEAWRLDKTNPGPLLYLAELQRQLGDVAGCVDSTERAWPNADKLESFAWERLAATRVACLFLDRRADEARAVYDQLARRAPASPVTARLVDFLRLEGAPFVEAPPGGPKGP